MIWELVGAFAAGVAVDVLYVMWTRRAVAGKALDAFVLSLVIQSIVWLAVMLAFNEPALVAANVFGHAVGSYLGVVLTNRRG